MHQLVAAGAAFLLAVLWFDLMFDVQVRRHDEPVLPAQVLASISAYYRRVTTEAFPMNRLVALVMLLTLASIIVEVVQGKIPWWVSWSSLLVAGSGFPFTLGRTVPNARRLGRATNRPEEQSRLARSIYRDHVLSFARMMVVLALQFAAA